jgi:hypothetical protein
VNGGQLFVSWPAPSSLSSLENSSASQFLASADSALTALAATVEIFPAIKFSHVLALLC